MAQVFSRINRNAAVFNRVVTGSSVDLVNRILQTTYNSTVQRTSAISANDHTIRPAGHRRLKDSNILNLASASTVTGRGRIRGDVGNDAPHARVVHEGRGSIYVGSTFQAGGGQRKMRWENAGGPYAGKWAVNFVRGANAQPFLVHAYNTAVSSHPETSTVQPMSTNRPRF